MCSTSKERNVTRKRARIIHQSLFHPCQSLISELKEKIYISLAEKLDVIGLIHPVHPPAPTPPPVWALLWPQGMGTSRSI